MIIQLQKNTPPKSGVVLFEVILALVLFSFAAIIIANSFSSSLRSVDRMRNDLDASNLAISTLSEIELGIETDIPREWVPKTALNMWLNSMGPSYFHR